jgi:transposase
MQARTTRQSKDTRSDHTLYIALELGHRTWCLRFGDGKKVRDVQMPSRELERFEKEVEAARTKFGLGRKCRVMSCYEAGWDGFWLHRYLESIGIENVIVDSSSIEVNRRGRRAKTDRLDVQRLHEMLLRYERGERVWSVVQVPAVEDEDARQPHRELERLKKERRRHQNRLQGLLVTQGVVITTLRNFPTQLEGLRLWDDSPLPARLRQALLREWDRLELVIKQIQELEMTRRSQAEQPTTSMERKVANLQRLRAIGENASWALASEFFGWRRFENGKQVGSLAGLAPTPYSSGMRQRELGINKAGNARVRRMMIQIAWLWLRYQPDTALSKWYGERFAGGGSRPRRVGLVALARKLLVALWQYTEYGVIPDGSRIRPAA